MHDWGFTRVYMVWFVENQLKKPFYIPDTINRQTACIEIQLLDMKLPCLLSA